jgi:uncharacterized protein YkwD
MSRKRVAVFVALLVCPSAVAEPESKETVPEAVVRLTNELRKAKNLAPFTTNEKLVKAAQLHAENMARKEMLEHDLDGNRIGNRIDAVGYKFLDAGENICLVGSQTEPDRAAAAALKRWENSEGHRENMLSTKFTQFGTGAARAQSGKWYFCQVFAKPVK